MEVPEVPEEAWVFGSFCPLRALSLVVPGVWVAVSLQAASITANTNTGTMCRALGKILILS